jgi:carbonic anhydrase/acetyltransferase-like protein (isoleucine patch superfamily)
VLIEHLGDRPNVDPSAYVAPTAVLCGDVTIGPRCRILFGAVLTAEGGPIKLGSQCIVMENAVVRASRPYPTGIGNNVLIGPRAYLSGCTVDNNVFLATGSTVFNGAFIGARTEVRINGVVHLHTRLEPDATVPIGWVAVGDPAEIHACGDHDKIWAMQEPLDFPGRVFGLKRAAPGDTIMPELTLRYGRALATHFDDRTLATPEPVADEVAGEAGDEAGNEE